MERGQGKGRDRQEDGQKTRIHEKRDEDDDKKGRLGQGEKIKGEEV